MTSAQNPSNSADFLIGEWTTVDISVPENADQLHPEVLQTLKSDFSQSTFVFRADGTGVVNIVSRANTVAADPSFEMEWSYDAQTGKLNAVGHKDDEIWTEEFEIEQYGVNIHLTIDGESPLTFTLAQRYEGGMKI